MGQGDHDAIKQFLPYIEDIRFLSVDSMLSGRCQLAPKDLDLIASWKELRVIRLLGLREALPGSWRDLEHLVSLEFTLTRGIRNLEIEIVDGWHLLESFSCRMCPNLEDFESFKYATLPRLSKVEVYGSKNCTSLSSGPFITTSNITLE